MLKGDTTTVRSLPTRERGLKRSYNWIQTVKILSLPTRERGLKQIFDQNKNLSEKSLPIRERGLKLDLKRLTQLINSVAPYTGAWIETSV